ncbi:hypothetical protein TSH7_33400, partial [Azospirillum sp. TSH7]
MKEAVTVIKIVGKSNPLAAGEGALALIERLWPAFEQIDTSSGALGSAVNKALGVLIPILIVAPADPKTRAKWLERLYQAVLDDGVQYLFPLSGNPCMSRTPQDLVSDVALQLRELTGAAVDPLPPSRAHRSGCRGTPVYRTWLCRVLAKS